MVDLTAPANTGGTSSPPPKATIINVTKSGKNYLIEKTNPDGSKLIRWKSNQFQATYTPGSTRPQIDYTPGGLYYVDFSKTDLPEFSWISASNYAGMAKMGGSMGMVFKTTLSSRAGNAGIVTSPHENKTELIAVVDAKTLMPLMLQEDTVLLTYQFSQSGDVTLTPEVQKAFDALRKEMQRASLVQPG